MRLGKDQVPRLVMALFAFILMIAFVWIGLNP